MRPTMRVERVPMKLWGKDHYSTLAYVECCVVDDQVAPGIGVMERTRLRANPDRHSMVAHLPGWDENHGTRLKGFVDRNTTPKLLLTFHDDWDCLDDMEAEGLITMYSMANCYIQITDLGMRVAQQLRQHKAHGGTFADFEPDLSTLEGELHGRKTKSPQEAEENSHGTPGTHPGVQPDAPGT